MGILDEAIKEHLELKRRHGAGDSELKKLEDEAFGQPERPGGGEGGESLAEAATELIAQPEVAEAERPEAVEEAPVRRAGPEIADLQEAPELEAEPQPEPEAPEPEPEAQAGPSTEERQAIADQPTELYEVGEEPEEEEEDFFDEQRLSDELDQALEAPGDLEPAEGEGDFEPEADDLEPEDDDFEPEEEPVSREADEDVLEETPDFLEEAPEDDRLWFEQKPPKDFDFDD